MELKQFEKIQNEVVDALHLDGIDADKLAKKIASDKQLTASECLFVAKHLKLMGEAQLQQISKVPASKKVKFTYLINQMITVGEAFQDLFDMELQNAVIKTYKERNGL